MLPAVVALAALSGGPAFGWGRDGHAIVGRAAQSLLCPAAAAEIARLADGEPLAQIGQWADQIRSLPEWAHSAPWHYVNVPDRGDPRHPPFAPGGHVITAIERFSVVLSAADVADEDRVEALRFLVHLVADIHQPLHVGRAEDRGGNLIELVYAGKPGNLHSFWDTDAIRLRGLGVPDYAALVTERARSMPRADRDVRGWAEQVFALRSRVYAVDTSGGSLSDEYVTMAAGLAESQLVLAAARLAALLNDAFCPRERVR